MDLENESLLKEISRKLDLLINITKLSNQNALGDLRNKIKSDKIASKILDYADGSISYSELAFVVSMKLGMSEISVKKKISELKELGLLIYSKKGKETFYENSGIL